MRSFADGCSTVIAMEGRMSRASLLCMAPLDLWHRSVSLLFRGEFAGVIDAP
jgi:hypothetical protein